MKKLTFLFLLLTITLASHSAGRIGEWNIYLSYHNAARNVVAGNTIYCIMDGHARHASITEKEEGKCNLLSYNTLDGEVRTYDVFNGLSGVEISHIAYSNEARKLIIVYADSNIDLLDATGNVQNLSALKNKNINNKEVNGILIEGRCAYLATGFGFVEIDMTDAIFKSTYNLKLNTLSITASDQHIYLATTGGVYRCDKTAHMQQKENWTLVESNTWDKIVWFQDNLVGIKSASGLFTIHTNGTESVRLAGGTFKYLKVSNSQLLCGNHVYTIVCTQYPALSTTKSDIPINDLSYHNGLYWASNDDNGLMAYQLKDKQLIPVVGSIHPNSPYRDNAYRLTWVGNRLLHTGGINTDESINNDPAASIYEDGRWTLLKEPDSAPLIEKYPSIILSNTTDLVQDPLDASHHYSCMHRKGLVEYRNFQAVNYYNSDNSPLCPILPASRRYYNYVSCTGLKYDGEGNLWMLNSSTDTIVRVLRHDGKWKGLYFAEISGTSLCDDYLLHSSGIKFVNCRYNDIRGFFAFEAIGNNLTAGRHILRTNIVNQDGTTYTPDGFYGMAEDFDGRIWLGTNLGLFVIDDPTTYFDANFHFTQVKINRDDGSGLADYLLNGLSINCIAIDGANRKWIGTHSNGVYLISADGQEMIHHFTTENSPLLSDMINAIAVNGITGEVMIGTKAGLCSYMSDATDAVSEMTKNDVVSYPNPVSADYTGPIAIRGLALGAEVKILSSSGQLIWSGTSNGGTCTWNGCNKSGKRVASGIYHVVANNQEGKNAVVSHIVVIK